MRTFSILLTAAAVLMFAGAAQAVILNIDINGHNNISNDDPPPLTKSAVVTATNTSGGIGAIGTINDFWNGVDSEQTGLDPLTISPLNPSSGFLLADGVTATSVTLSATGFEGADFFPQSPPAQTIC